MAMPITPDSMENFRQRRLAGQNPAPAPVPNMSIPTPQPSAPLVPPSAPNMSIPAPQPSSPLVPPATPQPPVAPNTSYEGGTFGNVNGINPVAVTPTSLTGMQPFIDAAYNQSASRLNPQFDQMKERFDQDMVNRGIQPGSAAYDKAFSNYSMAKNDAFASANNNAMGQGLAAQGQAWGQGAQQAGLAQAMLGYGLNRDQFDMNSLLGLTGLQQNNAAQNFNMGQSLLGMTPNQAPSQIDTYSPYQIQQSGINAANANAASSNNGLFGAAGTIGAALIRNPISGIPFLCARELKDPIMVADPVDCLKAVESLPLEFWQYKDGNTVHVGTYAAEFNAAMGLPSQPFINQIDLFGALIGAVQALTAKVATLEKSQ